MVLRDIVGSIAPLSTDAMREAERLLDSLAKPSGGFGELEEYAIRLAGITGQLLPDISRRAILVFAADNGVCAEETDSVPSLETRAQAINCARGHTAIAALARTFRATLIVADVGVGIAADYPGVRDLRVRAGTGNIRVEDAMTREEAEAAICTGAMLAQEMVVRGYGLLGVGSVSAGNRMTSAAVLAALTGVSPDALFRMDGSVSERRLESRRCVIREALTRADADSDDAVGVLAKLGGLDLCAMAGAYLGAASARIPVVLDGYAGCVAAIVAAQVAPESLDYMLPSHVEDEPGAMLALERLGLVAPLSLGMQQGEGCGCPLMFSLLDAAVSVFSQVATIEET